MVTNFVEDLINIHYPYPSNDYFPIYNYKNQPVWLFTIKKYWLAG